MNKMFIHYSGTVAAFKAAGLATTYNNSIVFISGDAEGTGAAVYTHGKYYANFNELQANLAYFSSISDGKTTATATQPNSVITFSGDDNHVVEVIADSTGIKISLSADAIAAIEAVASKADQSALNTVSADVNTIKGDYLKGSDKTELTGAIATAKSEAISAAATDATTKVDAALASAKTYTNDEIAKLSEVYDAKGAAADALADAKEYTDQEIAKLDSATLRAEVEANAAAIATLNGTDTGKSARAIANEAIAAALIPENAGESLDTLEEIAAWIQAHPEDAAQMNKDISAAQTQADKGVADAATAKGAADAAQTDATQALTDAAAAATAAANAKSAADDAQADATAANNAIAGMTLTEKSGYITKIAQANGVVTATAVASIPAADIAIADTDGNFTAENAEAAFAEVAAMFTWEEL